MRVIQLLSRNMALGLFLFCTAFTTIITSVAAAADGSEKLNVLNEPNAICISQNEMATIAKDFTQFKKLANAEFCYDSSTTSNLLATLMFMRHTVFGQSMLPSKDQLFSGKFNDLGSTWYEYFIGRIDLLEVVESCPKGVVAYVYGSGDTTMYACPLALTDTFSTLDRASVFMHEARHIDGYPHITCSRGARVGIQGACDIRITDTGSYAVSVETYAQLAQYATDVHPALKAYARAASVIYADEAFEVPVRVNRTEKILVVTSNLDFKSFNPLTGQYKNLGKIPVPGKIVRRAQHLVLFPEDKNLQSDYVFTRNEGKISQTAGEHFADYNSMTPFERADFIDYHSGTQFTARVLKSKVRVTCDPGSPTVNDMNMPAGEVPANMIYPNGYDRGASSALLSMQSGNVFEFGCLKNKRAFMKAAPLVKFDQNYRRVQKTAGKVFALSTDGQIFDIVDGRSKLNSAINDKVIEMTAWQTFEFFEQDSGSFQE